jgi:hypothetical protein
MRADRPRRRQPTTNRLDGVRVTFAHEYRVGLKELSGGFEGSRDWVPKHVANEEMASAFQE